jgi:hypothetical protein
MLGPGLEWRSVESSNLAAVAWQGGALYVRFHSRAIWRYESVPEAMYLALVAAKSKGSYFHHQVKKTHAGTRVG